MNPFFSALGGFLAGLFNKLIWILTLGKYEQIKADNKQQKAENEVLKKQNEVKPVRSHDDVRDRVHKYRK